MHKACHRSPLLVLTLTSPSHGVACAGIGSCLRGGFRILAIARELSASSRLGGSESFPHTMKLACSPPIPSEVGWLGTGARRLCRTVSDKTHQPDAPGRTDGMSSEQRRPGDDATSDPLLEKIRQAVNVSHIVNQVGNIAKVLCCWDGPGTDVSARRIVTPLRS